jgi:hypothetical protein
VILRRFRCSVFESLIGLLLAGVMMLNPRSLNEAHATTTVSIMHDRRIYLAADSKLLGYPKPICKIFEVGRLYFMVAGVLDAADYKFSVPYTVKQSYLTHPGIQASFENFKLRIQPKLVAYWNAWSKNNPDLMKKIAAMHSLSVTVTFAGYESNNSATMCNVHIQAMPPFIPGKFKIRFVDSDCQNSEKPPNNSWIFADGVVDPSPTCTQPRGNGHPTPIEAEACIISQEIKLHREEVGPPISILAISPLGSTWISQGVCPNEPSEAPPPPDN